MTIRCVIAGCNWADGDTMLMGEDVALCQCCRRCGSFHYLPQT
ncbi:PSPA7_2676 family Cys-rich small protein [Pseudomonas sp. SP16.1]